MKRYLRAILGAGLVAGALPVMAQPPGATPPPPSSPIPPPARLQGAPPPGARPPGIGQPSAAPAAPSTDYSKMFKDEKERNGYAIGMNIGLTLPQNLKRSDVDYDRDALLKGFTAGVAGDTNKLSEAQVREIIGMLQREMRTRSMEKQKDMEEKRKVEEEKNKKAGEAFLAAKKSEPGVIPLPSGLMYKVIKEGSGQSPKATDSVSVNYTGKLVDGTEFDSSAKTGKPATFRVTGVIKGWTEALELMKPGAKWTLYIPADLAYGDRSQPKIPSGSTLVFEVE